MKKNNFFKVIGLLGALFIVVFGNVANFLRTLKITEKSKPRKNNK